MNTAAKGQPTLHIVGGEVATDDGALLPLDVAITGDRISAVSRSHEGHPAEGEVVNAQGRIVAPGFIDLQINGAWGNDFTADPYSIEDVAMLLPSTGVSAFVPTIISSSAQSRAAAVEFGHEYQASSGSAIPIGIHLEGPAISPERPGAHAPHHIGRPCTEEVDGWSRSTGIAIVTLAPEMDGALDLISDLTSRGVVVSIGHTACTAERFAAARAAGATLVTHLFNAMAPFDHRAPGPIGATLADDTVMASLICDGIHIDPVAVRMAWRSLGPERTILVTDAMAALGLDASTARLGATDVIVDETSVRTPEGVLAGSKLALDQAVRNLADFTDCAPAEAIRTATATPARLLGLTDRGRIRVGARADLVILDQSLNVKQTIIGGLSAWKS